MLTRDSVDLRPMRCRLETKLDRRHRAARCSALSSFD